MQGNALMLELKKKFGLGILSVVLAGGLVGMVEGELEDDFGEEEEVVEVYEPKIGKASNEGALAMKNMKLSRGLSVEILAGEPLLANPVGFWIDDKGRYFVAETFRQEVAGVPDNRPHGYWLNDDLASESVDDRVAYYLKYHPEYADQFTEHHDRIRLLTDTDGDGVLDKATVYSDGYNAIEDGTGASVLVDGDDVYYTCIPKVWKLNDTDGDGRADEREVLHDGYGVRTALRGHDLHGLRRGPDGMLYFSIGDRGYNITLSDGKVLKDTETGAVFRCNMDGSGLEVFAYGLRNPQDLSFDKYGQLFTGDNNSDSIDKARWVYVLEGGHTGWRMAYQTLDDRGAWNREHLWHEMKKDQPAWLVPPIKHLGAGPSGVAYEPGGSALPKRYKDHFFMCDFRGGAGNSLIHSFELEARGAGFKLVGREDFVKGSLVTDVDFAPDGGLSFTDWVYGWTGVAKGRIYRSFDISREKDAVVVETEKLLNVGFGGLKAERLGELLGHADMRIRQRAQFQLVKLENSEIFAGVLRDGGSDRMAKIHAMWGLEQLGREAGVTGLCGPALDYLTSDDEQLRMIAADVLGRGRVGAAYDGLVKLLIDKSLRVRYSAAVALGKLGDKRGVSKLLKMLDDNGGKDPYLRHGGVMGLKLIGDVKGMMDYKNDSSEYKRMGVLLALRWLKDDGLVDFLKDKEPRLVVEAARGIYDDRFIKLMPDLAKLIKKVDGRMIKRWTKDMGKMHTDALLRRILAASFMSGKGDDLGEVSRIGLSEGVSEDVRGLCLKALTEWMTPSSRDLVHGQWRPLGERQLDGKIVRRVVSRLLKSKFVQAETAGAILVGKIGLKGFDQKLFKVLKDTKKDVGLRGVCLDSLKVVGSEELMGKSVKLSLADGDAKLRIHAGKYLADLPGADAFGYAERGLKSKSMKERQASVTLLGKIDYVKSDRLLGELMQKLVGEKLEQNLELEVLEAVARRSDKVSTLASALKHYRVKLKAGGLVVGYRDTLYGGDAKAGRNIFRTRAATQCMRCHEVDGIGGGDAGPSLTGVGSRVARDYLVESIVDPNAKFAEGFEIVMLGDKEGEFYSGRVKREDAKSLVLVTQIDNKDKEITILKSDIVSREKGLSAMPMDLMKHLSHRDLRDVIAFLANQKQKPGGKKVKKVQKGH